MIYMYDGYFQLVPMARTEDLVRIDAIVKIMSAVML